MIRLIVFDLDGTLIDSRKDLADSTNELVAELGGRRLPDDDVATMVGEGARMLVRRALAAAGVNTDETCALERFLQIYSERLLNFTVLYPGIAETIPQLARRCRLAVLTNKPSEPSRRILSGLGLIEYFSEIVGGDSPFGRKPDPSGMLHLCKSAGLAPASALLVGDSDIDVETAGRAGTRVCLARYGFGYRAGLGSDNGVDRVIDSPSELVHAIEGF
jgi:phosphoglycolate phosphatase